MFRADDIDRAADLLLASVDRDRNQPHYTDHYLQRKIRQSEKRDTRLHYSSKQPEVNYLLEREWNDILTLAHLTPTQRLVVTLRITGWTFEAIGQRRGCSKQGISNIWCQAIKKIGRVLHVYPYRGLADVYRNETRRGSPSGKGRMRH